MSEQAVWCEVITDCVTTDKESETPAMYWVIQDCGTTKRETADITSDLCRFTSSAGKNGQRSEKAVCCLVIPDCVTTVPERETPVLYGVIQDCGTTETETADIESDLCSFTSSAGKNGPGLNAEDMTSMCGGNVSSLVIDTLSDEDEVTPDGNIGFDWGGGLDDDEVYQNVA